MQGGDAPALRSPRVSDRPSSGMAGSGIGILPMGLGRDRRALPRTLKRKV
jgi:hypothetical protein